MSNSIRKTELFLEEFKTLTNKDLKNEIDVFNLIEVIYRLDNFQLLEDLAFLSKYCVGLYHILGQNKTEVSDDYKKEITKNFTEVIEQIKSKLNEIISHFSEFEKESFKTRYFEMTQSGMNNLFSIITDFSEIKLFLNQKKRTNQF
ncbi:MAG: hypothetical protein N3F03_00455 [Ignavibacteria bacterium]|nr:hypothetical protein [Ignavibacteria bacterium]